MNMIAHISNSHLNGKTVTPKQEMLGTDSSSFSSFMLLVPELDNGEKQQVCHTKLKVVSHQETATTWPIIMEQNKSLQQMILMENFVSI